MKIFPDKDYRGRVIYKRCETPCYACKGKKGQHFTEGKEYLVYGWDPIGTKRQEFGYLRLQNDKNWVRLFSAKHFEMVEKK